MGSLAIQPPNGITRNLTEVFVFLRNNAQQNQTLLFDSNADDKVNLIAFTSDRVVIGTNRNPPSWINVIDEINYEFTRIKSRINGFKEFQNQQLNKLDFTDEQITPEQIKIRELGDEITIMFNHARRLIRLIEEADSESSDTFNKIRRNVISSLMLFLNMLLTDFRNSQSTYLHHLDTRKSNLDSFLLKSDSQFTSIDDLPLGEEIRIDQIQQIIANEHMTKDREKEILRISKSIMELNSIFKDIGTMVIDQGTILDRIDYNIEQSSSKIKSALTSVEKAEKYQKKNRKMHLIVILAAFAIFLMTLIILTKI